jgi:ADP-heptose:LPS heptosyltransferase
MIKIILVFTASIFLSGCASLSLFGSKEKPLQVQTVAQERTKLNLPYPEPLNLKSPQWIIIHPDNAEEVWQQLRESNKDVVLFGLTDENYEVLATLMAEVRNHITVLKMTLEQYKKYYEAE